MSVLENRINPLITDIQKASEANLIIMIVINF